MKNFKMQILRLVVLSASLFPWTAAHAQITPSADSFTNSADRTTNYGANALLNVNGAMETTYIQFDLASIPSGAGVSQATLKLYVNGVTTAGSFNVDYVNGSWTESTIDASNAPPLGTNIASNVNVTTADKNQYILINVTSAVQAWLSGSEPNDGLALVANSTFDATFDSKENTGTSHPPELDIAYAGGDGTITGVTTASGSGLAGGGTSGTLNLGLTKGCSSGQVLSWNGSAWTCTALAGGGTITGVTAGLGLTGGGTSGNVTLNLDTTQAPLLAASNTFTASQTFQGTVYAQQTSSTFAISATNTTPSATTIVGVASANSGEGWGVEGETNSNSSQAYGVYGLASASTGTPVGVYGNALYGGTGVYGTSATGNAMVANGNVSQNPTGGGWVKAMVYVNGEQASYNIVHCFNSTLTGAAATTPPCGITLNEISLGAWNLIFNFEVDNRFVSGTVDTTSSWGAGTGITMGVHAVGTDTLSVSTGAPYLVGTNFWLIVF